PGLASVLTVEPGVEISNATEQPSQVTGTLAAGSNNLVLTNGAVLTLPQGLTGSITPLSNTAILEITTPVSGLTVLFDGSNAQQSLVVPMGSSVLLPDGAAPGTLGFSGGSYQSPALAVLPDGTQLPFSNNYGSGYQGTLPPGARLLFSTTSGTLNLGS